jgi:hypothetical protein
MLRSQYEGHADCETILQQAHNLANNIRYTGKAGIMLFEQLITKFTRAYNNHVAYGKEVSEPERYKT